MPTPHSWYLYAQEALDREQAMKRSRIKRKPRPDDDKVTPVYDEVMDRDQRRCIARLLDPTADVCRGKWGTQFSGAVYKHEWIGEWLTLDHVKDQMLVGAPIQKRKSQRAPSDPQHLVVLCWHHHLGGWATSNRDLERDYLKSRYA